MTLTETCETCPAVVGAVRLTRGADGYHRCARCHARYIARNPVAAVADAIEAREREAAPLADLPFALTPQIAQTRGKQEGLF